MDKLRMKAPLNAGGFSVGNDVYTPDADGIAEVAIGHVDVARSHGYETVDPLAAPPAPANDPNVIRVGGEQQKAAKPGEDISQPAPEELSEDEKAKAIADATTEKGELLSDDEKAEAVSAALAAKGSAKAAK